MDNYRDQPLSKGDYHNRVPTNNYKKNNKPVYNDEPKDPENYVQIPKKKQIYFENEVEDRNNRQYYQGNNKNDTPFSDNPYYNKAALEKVSNRSIITYLDQPNILQENCQKNELQKDNPNQNQFKQNEPISQYYSNEQRNRYQEIKNYYYNQNHQYKSILSPKIYSRDQLGQQEQQQQQQSLTMDQNIQSKNQQHKYQQANQSLYENPSFGFMSNQQQMQQQQSSNQPIQQQQFPYSQYSPQDATQRQIQNQTRHQQNNPNENYSQRDFQQSRQCTNQSTQRLHQDLPIQQQQQYYQRLQYLEELKSRLPNDDIFQQQMDSRMPQVDQYYKQEQNNRVAKMDQIAAVSRMQRSNEIDKDKQYYVQDHQNQYPQKNRNYMNYKGQDYYETPSQNRNNSNQQYLNLYNSNKYKDAHQHSHTQSYQRKNQQQQKTRTPDRYREDSYEREKQWFIQQTSHFHQNSQTINKRR